MISVAILAQAFYICEIRALVDCTFASSMVSTSNITMSGMINGEMVTMTGLIWTHPEDAGIFDYGPRTPPMITPSNMPRTPDFATVVIPWTPDMATAIIPWTPDVVTAPTPQTWTPPSMTQKQVYKIVGDKVGLKPKKVKEVADAMMELAATQLKSSGTFNLGSAFKMTFQARRRHASSAIKRPAAAHINVSPVKKIRRMLNACIEDAD